jgi:serine/threonine-protein kinase
MQSALACILALPGKPERALETLHTLEQLAVTRYVSPVEFMTTAFAADDRETGFRWLARACDERCFEMITLQVDPRFEPLRGDSRFVAAVRRIGLD